MNKRIFVINHWIKFLVFTPIAYFLWLTRFHHNHEVVLLALFIPISTQYVVAGIGTNLFKLWEFHTKNILGHAPIFHGIAVGAAVSLMTYISMDAHPVVDLTVLSVLRIGVTTGTFVGFWYWAYDICLVKSGFMSVYNRKYQRGADPETVVTDYSPMHFGVFGMCNGISMCIIEHFLVVQEKHELFWTIAIACTVVTMFLPTLIYVLFNLAVHGDPGLKSYKDVTLSSIEKQGKENR